MNQLGKTSIDSQSNTDNNVTNIATTDLTGDQNGQLITFDVYNKPEIGLEIIKVNENGAEVAQGTQFMIKNFNFGTNDQGSFNGITITLSDSNTFKLTDIVGELTKAGLKESDITKTKFYLEEVKPATNGRYNGLAHVIPFHIEKNANGVYMFKPYTKAELDALGFKVAQEGSQFYEVGKTRTVIKNKVYVEWESNGKDIKDVQIQADKGSIKYTVTNRMKPIEIKVAKLDENGNLLKDANTSFSLRLANAKGNGLYGTHNDPEDGILTFNADSTKIESGITLEPGKAYALWEEQAPAGYNTLGLSIIVKVDVHGVVSLEDDINELKKSENGYILDGQAEKIVEAINNGTISISQPDKNGIVTIKVKNYPKKTFEIQKKDESNNNLNEKVTFTIWAFDGRSKDITTDANGYLKTDDIANFFKAFDVSGKPYKNTRYVLVEKNAPEGYKKLATGVPFMIDGNGDLKLLNQSDLTGGDFTHEGNITTIKAKGNRPDIKVDWSIIGEKDSNKDIEIDKTEYKLLFNVKNYPIDNKLELTKVSKNDTSKLLENAKFSITKIKSETDKTTVKVIENSAREDKLWVTDDNGKWSIEDLLPGTYLIKEVSAPDQYHLTDEEVIVTVDEYTGNITIKLADNSLGTVNATNGTTQVEFTFANEPITYTLPETGGQGTWTCTVLGSMMILIGAGLLLGKNYLSGVVHSR